MSEADESAPTLRQGVGLLGVVMFGAGTAIGVSIFTVLQPAASVAGSGLLIAEAMNSFLQSRRDLMSLDQERISTSQLLAQEYVVTAETITNSLVISATPEYLDEILELAKTNLWR